MKRFKLLAISLGLFTASVFSALPSQAAIQRSADFSPGNTIGVGMFGLSYDYGIGNFSLGTSFNTSMASSFSYSGLRMLPSVRGMWRFMDMDGLSAGVLAGLQYDPGTVGGRAYLTPDLGVGMAYNFKLFELPMALRLNLTLALGNSYNTYYSDVSDQPVPNLFQRLTIGPQSSLELAIMPNQNLEITFGGGTVLGMRIKL
ncbi:hypothetical protein COW36_22335 [bacterium (Candidatus Blackallbacteria) CG17_big_fil_post_rev_8_21_14_2_50_48_46]|uniref:Outer membrane protein beta-barrel domain-containing protein n=1 Tax=bacterium (Candidatus Blackallbacteria) CG17_big_fil_post_rev_8_21_14_2_50_48_46 TaxID=2014261 RepID=A0A2M7FYM3_9BACT|nr:MAG: hypothetical protein COW64_13765 [bacterium (Candidatus Blackallbacteria) CG18_big_fil_WC_8_21_14_2_50_49_26]PIW14352.1 MAG: hypothetical protein COW36_22335 [bacterium (Candidatus Blackallbacteria) CG17_big_fil_post_rev_8_21_14_2_50_48_46]PIW45621.1 MAG: hypothetical protein COW20_19940 [bacterium (Candidatus Blackallbacteria) CG13_big_fil_rev_8_21_14_2_50_49_14]